jgi:phosphoribosylglycinamide formyltransferase 1
MGGRIVVLASGSGSNMVALARACKDGEVPGEVVAVATDRPCPAIEKAAAMGVETVELSPKEFASRDEWSAALRDRVAALKPDLVVSAGFMRILSPEFVDAFADRLINLHPSLLPAFPGAHAVRDALAAGVKVTGGTVHFVDHLVDHGPIVMQEPVRVHDDDSEDSLHERIKGVEHAMLKKACTLVLDGRVSLRDGKVIAAQPISQGGSGGVDV